MNISLKLPRVIELTLHALFIAFFIPPSLSLCSEAFSFAGEQILSMIRMFPNIPDIQSSTIAAVKISILMSIGTLGIVVCSYSGIRATRLLKEELQGYETDGAGGYLLKLLTATSLGLLLGVPLIFGLLTYFTDLLPH